MKKFVYLLLPFIFAVSTNAQIVWEPTGLSATCLGIKVTGSGTVFAGDNIGNIWKSTNNGQSWTAVNIGTSIAIADIEIAPNGFMFVTTGENETGNGVYRSSDGGNNWQHCTMTAGIVARDIELKSGNIFVSTKGQGLGRSTDNGDTWAGVSGSIPESNIGAFNISNNGTLLIGVKGSNGLYRSTNDGNSWMLTNFPQSKRVYSLTVASNNYIFAGTAEYFDGAYRSTDDGISWTKISGLPENSEYYFNGLQASDGKIYIGVIGAGVYCSSNYGDTWQLYNQGFQNLSGFALAEGLGGTIFATTGNGVYKSTGVTTVGNDELSLNNFRLEQNFPNPFNPVTSIVYEIDDRQFVSLKIYDVLGNEVASLVGEEQDTGLHSVNFDAAQISSGVYFYRLETGGVSRTKSMILIK